jgi:hypothetical protein
MGECQVRSAAAGKINALAAARATPHGKPVELVNRMSKPLEESNDRS